MYASARRRHDLRRRQLLRGAGQRRSGQRDRRSRDLERGHRSRQRLVVVHASRRTADRHPRKLGPGRTRRARLSKQKPRSPDLPVARAEAPITRPIMMKRSITVLFLLWSSAAVAQDIRPKDVPLSPRFGLDPEKKEQFEQIELQ